MVKTLLEAGANTDDIGETAMREARKTPEIAKLLKIPAAKEHKAASADFTPRAGVIDQWIAEAKAESAAEEAMRPQGRVRARGLEL